MNPMNKVVVISLIFLLSAGSLSLAQSVPELAQKALAATVSLEMQDENGDTLKRGSGFFVRRNLIATNFHVIDGAAKGYARLVNTATTYPIEGFTAANEANDLALLKVSAHGINPLNLGNSDAVQIGETVYVAGNPLGLEGTFSDGIISGRRDSAGKKERLQMTAPISPGSSGGPVLNRKGEVIGVSTSRYNPIFGVNLAFAVPSNALTALLRRPQKIKPLSSQTQSVSAETYRVRAYASIQLGNYEKAIRELDQALRMNPKDAWSYHNRGLAKAKLGRFDEAIQDYSMSIRINYHSIEVLKNIEVFKKAYEVYIDRGDALISLNKYTSAIADFNTAIRFLPNNAKARIGRGKAKFNLGRYYEANSDYESALRLKPSASAYKGRGNVRHHWKQYAKADADYSEALRLDPDDAISYRKRASCKLQLKRYFAALLDCDAAFRLDPNDAWAYLGRGLAWHLLNDSVMARKDYWTALRLAALADNQDLKRAIENLLLELQ